MATETRPPSVGTLTVEDVPLVLTRAPSPVMRLAGTWAGSVPSRDASSAVVAHGFIPASQAASPAVVWTQALTNAVAALTGPALPDAGGAAVVGVALDVDVVVALGADGGGVVVLDGTPCVLSADGGGGVLALVRSVLVSFPSPAMATRTRTALTIRLRQDQSGQRSARLTLVGLIPRAASEG
jgi:hypothetical protein